MGIFSDIMNLKDCVGFSDSGTSTTKTRRSGGYLGHGGEGIWGKELWLGLSEVQIEVQHGGERDCCRMQDSCQLTSGPCHSFNAPLFRPLGRMRTPPAAELKISFLNAA